MINQIDNQQNQAENWFRELRNQMVGSIQRCLVTGLSKKSANQLQARTECNRVVNFDFQNISFIGKLVDINIEEALSFSLLGSLHNSRGQN